MAKHIQTLVYLQAKGETTKIAQARDAKIKRLQKKLGDKATKSEAVRVMIDAYQE